MMKKLLVLFFEDLHRAVRTYSKPWTAWRELRERRELEVAWLENERWNREHKSVKL